MTSRPRDEIGESLPMPETEAAIETLRLFIGYFLDPATIRYPTDPAQANIALAVVAVEIDTLRAARTPENPK